MGLLCLKTAKEGGLSSWASAIAAHNELLRLGRRDLVETLQQRGIWFVDRKAEVPPGKEDYYELPVFNYHDVRLRSRIVTGVVMGMISVIA